MSLNVAFKGAFTETSEFTTGAPQNIICSLEVVSDYIEALKCATPRSTTSSSTASPSPSVEGTIPRAVQRTQSQKSMSMCPKHEHMARPLGMISTKKSQRTAEWAPSEWLSVSVIGEHAGARVRGWLAISTLSHGALHALGLKSTLSKGAERKMPLTESQSGKVFWATEMLNDAPHADGEAEERKEGGGGEGGRGEWER